MSAGRLTGLGAHVTLSTGCYDEALVAELPDYLTAPIDSSLDLLQVLHVRWAELVRSLSWEQLQRTFVNPESGENTLARTVGVYTWHGRHHLAHVERLIERENWS